MDQSSARVSVAISPDPRRKISAAVVRRTGDAGVASTACREGSRPVGPAVLAGLSGTPGYRRLTSSALIPPGSRRCTGREAWRPAAGRPDEANPEHRVRLHLEQVDGHGNQVKPGTICDRRPIDLQVILPSCAREPNSSSAYPP